MPELPEVEILTRHLRPLLRGQTIRRVDVRRAKVIAPTTTGKFRQTLTGSTFAGLARRGKNLLFKLQPKGGRKPFVLLGHLGMTGRMFVARDHAPLPKHAAVVLELNGGRFIYEDTRYFGRLTLDNSAVARLGPEPLGDDFTAEMFMQRLKKSRQAIKVKLLDQSLVAGIGNIYASEALFRARISPKVPAAKLNASQAKRLHRAIRLVLAEAIACGSTIPLNYGANGKRDRLFYFGRAAGAPDYYEERLRVYDREGQSCWNCGTAIKCIVQAARSTFFCPNCQRNGQPVRRPVQR